MSIEQAALQSNSGQYAIIHVLGRRTTWTNATDLHDIGTFFTGTTFPTTTAADALELISSSTNDTAAGTGTRKVKVTYISNGELLVSPAIELSGTTAVPAGFTADNIICMEAVDGGSSEVSAGNVDLRKVTGGTVLERILAGGNKSLSGRFTVPTGAVGYVVGFHGSAINQSMDLRLRAQVETLSRDYNPRYLFQDILFLQVNGSGGNELPYLEIPAGATIKASSIAGATTGNPRCDCDFTILLVKR